MWLEPQCYNSEKHLRTKLKEWMACVQHFIVVIFWSGTNKKWVYGYYCGWDLGISYSRSLLHTDLFSLEVLWVEGSAETELGCWWNCRLVPDTPGSVSQYTLDWWCKFGLFKTNLSSAKSLGQYRWFYKIVHEKNLLLLMSLFDAIDILPWNLQSLWEGLL
jgi:hypothetical protein